MYEQKNDQSKYLKTKEAAQFFNVSPNTIRSWEKRGLIKVIRTNKSMQFGHRRYDISSYNNVKIENTSISNINNKQFKNVCYCRVSSKHQSDDLERQIAFMQQQFPNHEIIKDIESGINFKRPGLLKIITASLNGELNEIVVAHKDRLTRFAFDLLEWLFKQHNTKLVVLDNRIFKSPEQEL